MKVRLFVSSSAALLLGWLGLTYVRAVPPHGYPVLGRDGRPVAAASTAPSEPATTAFDLTGKATQASKDAPVAAVAIPAGVTAEVR